MLQRWLETRQSSSRRHAVKYRVAVKTAVKTTGAQSLTLRKKTGKSAERRTLGVGQTQSAFSENTGQHPPQPKVLLSWPEPPPRCPGVWVHRASSHCLPAQPTPPWIRSQPLAEVRWRRAKSACQRRLIFLRRGKSHVCRPCYISTLG